MHTRLHTCGPKDFGAPVGQRDWYTWNSTTGKIHVKREAERYMRNVLNTKHFHRREAQSMARTAAVNDKIRETRSRLVVWCLYGSHARAHTVRGNYCFPQISIFDDLALRARDQHQSTFVDSDFTHTYHSIFLLLCWICICSFVIAVLPKAPLSTPAGVQTELVARGSRKDMLGLCCNGHAASVISERTPSCHA